MTWAGGIVVAIIFAGGFVAGCCRASGRADDATDELASRIAHGDVPSIPHDFPTHSGQPTS